MVHINSYSSPSSKINLLVQLSYHIKIKKSVAVVAIKKQVWYIVKTPDFFAVSNFFFDVVENEVSPLVYINSYSSPSSKIYLLVQLSYHIKIKKGVAVVAIKKQVHCKK